MSFFTVDTVDSVVDVAGRNRAAEPASKPKGRRLSLATTKKRPEDSGAKLPQPHINDRSVYPRRSPCDDLSEPNFALHSPSLMLPGKLSDAEPIVLPQTNLSIKLSHKKHSLTPASSHRVDSLFEHEDTNTRIVSMQERVTQLESRSIEQSVVKRIEEERDDGVGDMFIFETIDEAPTDSKLISKTTQYGTDHGQHTDVRRNKIGQFSPEDFFGEIDDSQDHHTFEFNEDLTPLHSYTISKRLFRESNVKLRRVMAIQKQRKRELEAFSRSRRDAFFGSGQVGEQESDMMSFLKLKKEQEAQDNEEKCEVEGEILATIIDSHEGVQNTGQGRETDEYFIGLISSRTHPLVVSRKIRPPPTDVTQGDSNSQLKDVTFADFNIDEDSGRVTMTSSTKSRKKNVYLSLPYSVSGNDIPRNQPGEHSEVDELQSGLTDSFHVESQNCQMRVFSENEMKIWFSSLTGNSSGLSAITNRICDLDIFDYFGLKKTIRVEKRLAATTSTLNTIQATADKLNSENPEGPLSREIDVKSPPQVARVVVEVKQPAPEAQCGEPQHEDEDGLMFTTV